MKKLKIFFLFVTCLCISNISFSKNSTVIDCNKLPANPMPRMAVVDNANIIDDSYQAILENQLRDFWNKDSIAVCVVTIPTLNGYDQFDYSMSIATCWKIGGKDNRGLLLFISLDERKISIRTGYGLEAYITDAKSNQIKDAMVPYFKSKDYGGGVKYAVDEILSTLGDIPLQERVQAAHERKLAEDKQKAESFDILIDVFFLFLFIVLFIGIIYLLNKQAKIKKIRNQVRVLIDKVNLEIKQGHDAIAVASIGIDKAANWVKKEALVFKSQCEGSLNKAVELLRRSESCLKEDPMEADALARESSMLVEKAFKTFVKFNENLRAKVKKFSTECPVLLKGAQGVVEENKKIILDYIAKGFIFSAYLKEQEDLGLLLQKYQENISDVELFPKICTDSEIIKGKSNEVINQITQTLSQKLLIDGKLDTLVKEAAGLYEKLDEQKNILSSLKTKYPNKVWQDIDLKIKKVPEKLSPEIVNLLQLDIKRLNNMENQKFQSAAVKFTALGDFVNDVKNAYSDLLNITAFQEKNQQACPKSILKAEESVCKALDITKDSDVSTRTRNSAKEIAQQLRDIKIETKKSIVDWSGIIFVINTIISNSDSLTLKAHGEISDADSERRRKAREEAAAIAETKRRNDESYTASMYSSSSSSSSSSDSGFGGFDGGSFGGGGADGGW
ncbi:MAG: TPM domain-containing protein [Minisyncoccia bacterium]